MLHKPLIKPNPNSYNMKVIKIKFKMNCKVFSNHNFRINNCPKVQYVRMF